MELLTYSNELKKNNRDLRMEDPEKFNVLLKFLVRIERNLNYLEKETYISLIQDFLGGEVTAEDFSYIFPRIYHGANEKLSQMKKEESSKLKDLLEPSRFELGELLVEMYGACDGFSLDPEVATSDETELKNCAEALLLKLQEE